MPILFMPIVWETAWQRLTPASGHKHVMAMLSPDAQIPTSQGARVRENGP